jgi:asparagine synthase (glutamine-hydrolysing)
VCGIAGILDPTASVGGEQLADSVARMTGALAHRGPDDEGVWVDAAAGVALGHRRLAVIDLSRAGHQPMVSAGGRYVISYNGELYNFMRLRPLLERAGATFSGRSDTEVLLAGIEHWGVHEMLDRCNGMFAFALWDRHERTLTLARDRLGEKPLYYGRAGSHLVCASELRAIRRHPLLVERIDRAALAAYLRYGYVPAPSSIIEGVAKLGPGELLTIRPGEHDRLRPTPYWSLSEIARAGRAARAGGATPDEQELQAELHELLCDAVRLRLAADVPLGAFLSGGIDSSTLVALMRRAGAERVRTFSVGFEDPAFDEAGHAAAVAAHLETEHTELRVSAGDALAEVPRLAAACDEPFADPALLPTLLVARLARRDVTVAFAGDGGDELFGGYPRYRWAELLRRALHWMPPGARRGLAVAGRRAPAGPANRLGALLGSAEHELAGDRLLKLAELAAPRARDERLRDPARLYERLVSCWLDPPVRGGGSGVNPAFTALAGLADTDMYGRMTLVDSLTYLPDDILTKVDRATMAVSLEARVPLLDHRVVELAWRMQPAQGLAKQPLREILYRYVPRELVDRPKRGFAVPLAQWLRGPLRPWAEELLEPRRLAAQGHLDPTVVARHWREHLSGARNWHRRIWPILLYQSWLLDSGGDTPC